MAYNGTENMIPITQRTKSEQKEIAKKGGQKSGEARRLKKTFKETFEKLLLTKYDKYATDSDLVARVGDINPKLTMQQAITLAMTFKAINGDVAAYTAIRDTVGEKPTDKVEHGFPQGDFELTIKKNDET